MSQSVLTTVKKKSDMTLWLTVPTCLQSKGREKFKIHLTKTGKIWLNKAEAAGILMKTSAEKVLKLVPGSDAGSDGGL